MKLRLSQIVLSAFLLLGFFSYSAACGVNWEVPQNHFDAVNEWGYLSYWRDIGTIDFGNDLKIPLIIGFNSTRGNSPYLGHGWIMALLESSIVQVSENQFLLTQPDGIVREFWRKQNTDTVLQGQGDWKAEIKDDTITAWASCGWKLTFDHGKITSISTPEGRQLLYTYNNGLVQKVSESGNPGLTTEWNSDGSLASLSFNDKKVSFEQGQKPEIEVIEGKNLVSRMENSLHKVISSEGITQVYDFKVDDKAEPTLKVSGDAERNFTWDPETKKALKDGDWNYDIKLTGLYDNAQIGRTNKNNEMEYWFKDVSKGVETILDADGTKTITTTFTSGLLSGQLREVQTYKNNVLISTNKIDYDENGRVLRKLTVDKDSKQNRDIEFTYLPDESIKIDIKTAQISTSRTYDPNGKFVEVQTGTN